METIWKYFFVVRDGVVGHGDFGAGGEGVGFVDDCLGFGDAWNALGDTVGQAQGWMKSREGG